MLDLCSQGYNSHSKEDALLELHDAASVAVQALEQEGEAIPQFEPDFVTVESMAVQAEVPA